MEREEFLSRRGFLQKSVALGAGAMLEALLLKSGQAAAQSLSAPALPPLDERLPSYAPADMPLLREPVVHPGGTPASLVDARSRVLPGLYAANSTQIEDLKKGKWEGLFYLASDLVQVVSRKYDIPEDLIHSICLNESAAIPTHRSRVKVDVISRGRSVKRYSYARGAIGLAQVMGFHARQPDGTMLDLTHMQTNLTRMAQIFNAYRERHRLKDDWVRLTLYDYNAGPNRTITPPETVRYAEQVITLWKDPRRLKRDLLDRGWADMSLLYWDLLPANPLPEPFVRTGVDFGEPYAGQPRHTGLDLGGPRIKVGTEVRAVASGKIVYVGPLYDRPGAAGIGRGKTVVIEHRPANPLVKAVRFVTSGYCHLADYARGVAPGAVVERGQVIGYVGVTGWTTGAHLHFECARNTPVNPRTRRMAHEGGWFHPFLLLPPNQGMPGPARLRS